MSVAAGNGHTAVVSALLGLGVDVNTKDKHDRTPLWWAARNGHAGTVRTVLGTGLVDCESPDTSGQTVLAVAAANGHSEVLEILLAGKDRVQIQAEDFQGRTALSWAAEGGHKAAVSLLLKAGADTEIHDVHGWTALHWAAARGHAPVIEELQRSGANHEAEDIYGRTALSWSAGNGHVAAVDMLLRVSTIDANSRNDKGRTPLSWAADSGHMEVILTLVGWATKRESDESRKLKRYKQGTPLKFALDVRARKHVALRLAEHGLDIDLPDAEGRSPLSWASGSGRGDVAEVLIEHGAEIENQDNDDRTPLWWAAEHGHYDMLEMLLGQDGVDTHRQDKNGETALSRARFKGFDDITGLLQGALLGRTAGAESSDTDFGDLLLWAVKEAHGAVVEFFLQEGAEPNAKCSDGSYPLGWAAERGNVEIARLLVDAGAPADAFPEPFSTHRDGTSLWRAAMKGHEDMVEYLLTEGADLHWKGTLDDAPLTHAVKARHKDVVALLLRHGADLMFWPGYDHRAQYGYAYDLVGVAVEREFHDIANILVDYAIEVLDGRPYGDDQRAWPQQNISTPELGFALYSSTSDYPDSISRTLLSHAIQIGHTSAVEWLSACWIWGPRSLLSRRGPCTIGKTRGFCPGLHFMDMKLFFNFSWRVGRIPMVRKPEWAEKKA